MAGQQKLIIVGGGLAGSLAALAMNRLRPHVPLLLLEAGERFGENHVWSFFDTDVGADDRWLVAPLIVSHWPEYRVSFPRRERILPTGYNSISSERLDAVVRAELAPERLRTGCRAASLEPDRVVLESGDVLTASAVIDARGPANFDGLTLGWQKFVGRTYVFAEPHGEAWPVVMDATVDQQDGYRFVYCLPFDEKTMLVEDTYYSLSPALDAERLERRLDDYVAAHGWKGARVANQEQGVLPVALGGSLDGLWNGSPVPRLGLAGGFFHPTTGYSFPDAVGNALLLARQVTFDSDALHALFRSRARSLWRRRAFYRLLNRMLFHAAAPADRYRVLEHFYRLDAGVVERFYGGRSTFADKARIVSGKPPVPIRTALAALMRQERTPQ